MAEPTYIYPQELMTVTVHTSYTHDYTFPASTTSEARNYVMEMLMDPAQAHYLDELCTKQQYNGHTITYIHRESHS